ncbi:MULTISPECIES: DeoR/GlpR family DNA-binding transcription regulator [unclassified Roseitalea]|uniref:DeoR/GlpR family DNA-binding transcription regulator n=1 Tax=unclassified Roseitalea TaxID=2639107 RepID=UPI00273E2412|nr:MULTISPECIES: DeoR/GlpR family DNA-binding transcription regulator [unclassified Roseitalea]
MSASLRRRAILEHMRNHGSASVEALAERFGVTGQTIRRDLTELAGAGKIDRVHGGAMMRAGVSNIVYEERRRLNAPAKEAIARVVAAQVPDNVSLFINIGTTTEAVARALRDHRNITVVTNNVNVANMLAVNESCEIIVSGGTLRRSDGGLVGDLATQTIEQFKVDIAVIGASALDAEGDMLDYDLREVRVSRAIIGHARRVFVVADRSKLDRTAPVRIASLAEMDALFTDAPVPEALASRCEDWGTDVFVCPPGKNAGDETGI